MTAEAEQIVRALAAADPEIYDISRDLACALCGEDVTYQGGGMDKHEPDCPWRLAVEWTVAEDARAAHVEAVNASEREALNRRS